MRLDYYLYAALQASESNEHAKAFFLLELCNETDPDNPTVCSMRGAYMQSLYDKKTALPLLRKAYEGSPDDYWYRYAVTAYETGHRDVTMKVLKNMRKRQPKDIDVLELYESIYRHEHKTKEALAIRDAIDKLTGEPTEQSVMTRFDILRGANRGDEAFRVLEDYLVRDPNNGRVQAMRTDILLGRALSKSDRASAREYLRQMLHNPDVPLQRKLWLVNTYRNTLGYDEQGKRALLLELRDMYPYEQQVYQALLDYEKEQENYSAALEIGRTMLNMNPTDAELREQIANLMRDDDSVTTEEVGLFIDESYAVLPDNPKWGYFKALRCWQHGDQDSTLIVLERTLKNAEEPMVRLELLVLYGDLNGQLKRYDKAYAAYDEALKLAPDHIGVLNNYAWTLAISGGDLKKAEKMSQRTIQKDANNPTYLDTYAWILHLQGQDTLALFYIKKAMENATHDDGTIAEHYKAIKDRCAQR